jgi:isopentenyl-diphosphate delta-isomerase
VPGEEPATAAVRRLREETALAVDRVEPAGAFTYRAVDAESGFVEHEYDHVFVAYADTSRAVADPQEIDELAVLPYDEALALVESRAGAPWAAEVLRRSFTAFT